MLKQLREMPIWNLVIGFVLVSLIAVFLFAGLRSCSQSPAMATETPTAPETKEATGNAEFATLVPTATPQPTPTATATQTPTPRPTNTPHPTFTPSPTPIIVITGVNELGRLETTRYMMRDIVEIIDAPETFIERFSEDKLMLIAEGEVVAGFDLSKVRERDIYAVRDTVLIMLPPAEILYTRIDNDRTYVYERETGIFRRPDPDLETEARRIAEDHLESWAIERGILAEAEADGIQFLENFLRSLGFQKVRIEVREEP